MAFIRIKKIKGYDYYYLVRSQWDPIKKRSTQHIIKYLGNAENINIKDIPEEYRNDPRVLSLLALSSTVKKEKPKHD
jgi:MerR family transcriptional regulator, light-induced transcriptional regulator